MITRLLHFTEWQEGEVNLLIIMWNVIFSTCMVSQTPYRVYKPYANLTNNEDLKFDILESWGFFVYIIQSFIISYFAFSKYFSS